MGVSNMLPLLKYFLASALLGLMGFFIQAQATAPLVTHVSQYPLDSAFVGSNTTDFFGVDGSVLIHTIIRRCMLDIVLLKDFHSFKDEMRICLTRLQMQTRKFGTPDRNKSLFVVF